MKGLLKSVTLISLTGIFFFTAIACCCLSKDMTAQFQQASVSGHCHETQDGDHPSQSSHSTEDCDCGQSFYLVTKDYQHFPSQVQIAKLELPQLSSHQFPVEQPSESYQAPPNMASVYSIPLYLKNSTLRI